MLKNKYLHYVKFDGKKYEKCSEISKYSNDELLMEFKSIIEPLCNKDNIDNHIKLTDKILPNAGPNRLLELNPNDNWWCLRIQGLRGHKGTNDYFTIISNNPKEINNSIGLYKDLRSKKIFASNIQQYKKFMQFYIPFDIEKEVYNFVNYIKTDFVRMCLFLSKHSMNQVNGELSNIPWFDFSNPIFSKSPSEIDDYLFNKLNISDEIRQHIEELLPDYYGIRKG